MEIHVRYVQLTTISKILINVFKLVMLMNIKMKQHLKAVKAVVVQFKIAMNVQVPLYVQNVMEGNIYKMETLNVSHHAQLELIKMIILLSHVKTV